MNGWGWSQSPAVKDPSSGSGGWGDFVNKMFNWRYGADSSQQPAVLARQDPAGYPVVDSSKDIGEAERYWANRRFAEQHPVLGALGYITNPIHELTLANIPGVDKTWGTSLDRIKAGWQGADDAYRGYADQD